MVIRETPEAFIFITQKDHAQLAGDFFLQLKKDFIPQENLESLKHAIYHHDDAWIIPDAEPLWNDELNKPYDFNDFPERIKIHFYKHGIEQVYLSNSYAGLLCSMHYASFYKETDSESGKIFHEKEILRQKFTMQKLKIGVDNFLKYQLKILQFCDDLSLYICLNKIGVSKAEEHYFFKDGFTNSEFFNEFEDSKIVAFFKDRQSVKFNSSPFETKFELKIPFKRILKESIDKIGLQKAYNSQPIVSLTVKIM